MALRGLREKITYVHNPLPPVTDAELLRRAGLDYIPAAEATNKFSWYWQYDSGVNHEFIRLHPGDFVALREKEAKGFLAEFAEQGAVTVEDPEDVAEVTAAKLKGLTASRKFWIERGTKRAMNYRKVHGIGLEELKEMKGDHWPWYQNEEAARVCDEESQRLKSGGPVETPRAKKSASNNKKAK